ncbi:pirin family protein [Saccharibacter floricola]|uniref:Pirin n=1 Tax=Saccharibacter floricola DSM 15669 TaxID=1123227 RepID=A0ABQ0NYE6_9PROT|nr:pirin family protein [Saccharibacter floricola]GBQ06538.1 pirin [Saccharibacter floricola DSM 15669]
MIEIRPFTSLGHANHGWLNAHHHFSFANYYDPARMHWGRLRVWNDDLIAPQTGFPTHPHADMEIVTYVRKGAITHRDTVGNEGRTEAGDVQVMSAGTGIAHSEYNLEDEDTLIFQIWMIPDQQGHKPSWGQRPFPKKSREGQFVALASGFPEDKDTALPIHTPGRVLGSTLRAGQSLTYALNPQHKAYLVPSTGTIDVNGHRANTRDGVAIENEETLTITAHDDAELVMVETAS